MEKRIKKLDSSFEYKNMLKEILDFHGNQMGVLNNLIDFDRVDAETKAEEEKEAVEEDEVGFEESAQRARENGVYQEEK